MTLLAFLLALGVLITVHEWGHYRVAVACGVKVLTFSIGFGQPLLRWTASSARAGQNTEFIIGMIPLGGFVKMLDERDSPVTDEALHMAFNRQPLWARAAIVAAGPVANLVLAVVLYAATFWLGQYETRATLASPVAGSLAELAGLQSGDTVLRAGTSVHDLQEISSFERLRWWVLQTGTSSFYLEVQSQNAKSTHLLRMPDLSEQDSDEKDKTEQAWRGRGLMGVWSRAVLAEVLPGGAADAAGLKAGDEVLRVEGRQVSDANFLRNWVRDSGLQQIPSVQTWEVVRPGVGFFRIEVTPRQVNEMGQSFGRIDAKLGEPPAQVWVQSGAIDGLAEAVVRTYEAIRMTLSMLGRLLTGQASWDNLSGPLTMADYAGRSASLGVGAYLSYLALVSVSLGVFNLLPLPVLDGGHLLYYLYEALTGRAPSVDWLEALQRVGVVVLVALMSFSLFNDVVRLGWLP